MAEPMVLSPPGVPTVPDTFEQEPKPTPEISVPTRKPYATPYAISNAYQTNSGFEKKGHRTERSDSFRFGGWLQQSFTANPSSPSNRQNYPVAFNYRSNDYLLQQLNLFAERPIYADGSAWEWGGRADLLFGSDAKFLESRGLEDKRDGDNHWNSENGMYGLALPQAHFDFGIPVAEGCFIRFGKFYSVTGFETAAAPANFFISRSYLYTYGSPFTLTGMLGSIKLGQSLTFRLGGTRGWDVFDSNASEYGVLIGMTYTPTQRTSLSAHVLFGDDRTSFVDQSGPRSADRVFVSFVLQHYVAEHLLYVLEHGYGVQEDGRLIVDVPASQIGLSSAQWFGFNQSLIWEFSDQASMGLRAEIFSDRDQRNLTAPVEFQPGGRTFNGGNYVQLSYGMNWRPRSNLIIRPEIRADWSDTKSNPNVPGGLNNIRVFNSRQDASQFLAAFDVVWKF